MDTFDKLSKYIDDDEVNEIKAVIEGLSDEDAKDILDDFCFEYTGHHIDELADIEAKDLAEDEEAADEDTARALEALDSFSGIQRLAASVEGGEELLEALKANNLGEGTLNGGALPFELREELSNEPDVLGSWPSIINDFYKDTRTGDPEEDKKIHEMQNSIIKKDVNGDGDTDIVEADTTGDGNKDTAAVSAESKSEKKEAEKQASDDLKEENKEKDIDSTGNTTVSSASTKNVKDKDSDKDGQLVYTGKEKGIAGVLKKMSPARNQGTSSDERIKDVQHEAEPETTSDMSVKNIIGALRDKRF